MTTPSWMPPTPEAPCWFSSEEANAWVQGWETGAEAAVEAYKKSLKPVAWGVPNSRITERQPFLSLLHQLPVEGGVDGRRKTPLYPAMLVPLYRLDGGNDDAA